MKSVITQSPEWKSLQDDLGETSFFEQGSGYQYLAIVKSTPAGNYLYLPYGPVYEDKRGYENSLKALKLLAKRQDAIFIRLEPRDPDFTNHLPRDTIKSKDLNPKETWILDLTGKDEDLITKLPSRLMRYYKSAPKKGITIEQSHDPDDIHYLLDLQRALAKEKGINTYSSSYLKTELSQPFATLYLVKYQPSPDGEVSPKESPETKESPTPSVIAAGLVFDDHHTRYNLQGAQSDQGRKLHATGILTIQLILDAKAKKLQTFDFWGIAPEGAPASHPWAGFTNFKKTFAGQEVDYAGTYDIVLQPSKYKIYRLLRKANKIIHR